jgi:hypothetical protein
MYFALPRIYVKVCLYVVYPIPNVPTYHDELCYGTSHTTYTLGASPLPGSDFVAERAAMLF